MSTPLPVPGSTAGDPGTATARAPAAPHPALRRLFALGGAPARVMRGLARGERALERAGREPERWALLEDGPAAALVRGPDLEALFGAALRAAAEGAEIAGEVPVGAARRRRARGEGAEDTIPPGTGSVETSARPAAAAGRRIGGFVKRAAPIVGRVARARAPSSTPATEGVGAGAGVRAGAGADATRAAIAPHPIRGLDAAEALRRRALRAGAPGAADRTLVLAPPDPELSARLLSAGAPLAPGRGTAVGAASPGGGMPAGGTVPPAGASSPSAQAAPAAGAIPAGERLVRVLERLGPGRISLPGAHAPAGRRALSAPGRITAARDRARGPDAAPAPPASGLRRLLALSGNGGGELPPDSLRPPAAPGNLAPVAAAAVVAARLRDAELGQSLERLLRREARREGIDLEGLGA